MRDQSYISQARWPSAWCLRAGGALAGMAWSRWRRRVAAAATLTAISWSCFRAFPSTTASSSTSSSPPRPVSSSTLCDTSASSEVTRRASLQPVDGSTCRTVASRSDSMTRPPRTRTQSAPRIGFAWLSTPVQTSPTRTRQTLRANHRGRLFVMKRGQAAGTWSNKHGAFIQNLLTWHKCGVKPKAQLEGDLGGFRWGCHWVSKHRVQSRPLLCQNIRTAKRQRELLTACRNSERWWPGCRQRNFSHTTLLHS